MKLYAINRKTKEHRNITKCSNEEYQYVYCNKEEWNVAETDEEGWIVWKGESFTSPVSDGVLIELKFRDNYTERSSNPECYIWQHYGEEDDIMSYKIIEPHATCDNMTLDDFDKQLKELLREAGRSGIGIEYISVDTVNVSTGEKAQYVVDEVDVRYRRR